MSLAFAAPLLVAYELGVFAFPDAVRNGADVWMRGWLGSAGLGGYCLLPSLTVALLLAWHHTTRQPWRLPRGVLLGMAGESLLLGLMLLAFAQAGGDWFAGAAPAAAPAAALASSDASRLGRLPVAASISTGDGIRLWIALPAVERLLARAVQYLGAGLYEEVLFRLLLLPALLGLLATRIANRKTRVALAVGATSLLFAAAHHVGAGGEPLLAGVFAFRTAAGAFFAMLFLRRGFGIAIGAHAAYDLIAGLVFH